MGSSSSDKFSVLVLASDLGIDARPFLNHSDSETQEEEPWHDCPPYLDEDFSDLEALQFFRLEPASDKAGNRILRIVGKYFPAVVIDGERLKRYVVQKMSTQMGEGPYCILYMHSMTQRGENSPGVTILRWIYEELPTHFKDRLQVVYFVHPGLLSRLALATVGRWFLTGGLYWKIKYVSRLQYLWDDIKKGGVEIPEFVQEHDDILEHRPLTDYGIEPDPLHLTDIPTTGYPFGRYQAGWASREYMS